MYDSFNEAPHLEGDHKLFLSTKAPHVIEKNNPIFPLSKGGSTKAPPIWTFWINVIEKNNPIFFEMWLNKRSTYEPDILITFGTDINYLEQILINWNRYELLGTDINYSEQIF